MPIAERELRGTEEDGTKSKKYCHYCYEDGAFKQPNVTLDEMIEISAKGWSNKDPTISYEQAKSFMKKHLPHLERWRK